MGRNRFVGAPYQPDVVTADTTTRFWIDLLLVNASLGEPVTVTLDPNAVQGDQVVVQDVGNNAAAQNIVINASPGQTIINVGSTISVNTNGGGVQLSYDDTLSGWVPVRLTLTAGGGGGGVTSVTATAPIVSSGGDTPNISITAATESAAGSMGAADKLNVDGFFRILSNTGDGAESLSRAAVNIGSIYVTQAESASNLVFDPSTYTYGTTTFGPFVWGVYGEDAAVFRFDVITSIFDVIPLNGVAPDAAVSAGSCQGGVAVDADGNGWVIETTSNTLVMINGEKPYIAATYPIPNSPKKILAYDPVNNAIILLHASSTAITQPIARFDIGTQTFSADVTVGVLGEAVGEGILVAGGFVFIGTGRLSFGPNSSHVYQLDPVTLATLASAHITPTVKGQPLGYAYLPNSGTPKLFVTLGMHDQLFRIDVTTMAVDTSYTQAGAQFLGLAINPLDGSLWATNEDAITSPSAVFQLTNVLGSFTLNNTYTVSGTTNANTSSIVWDATDEQMVVSSDTLDEIYGLDQGDGSINFQAEVAGGLLALQPGTTGFVLTSNGPGMAPGWAAASSGGLSFTNAGTPIANNPHTTLDAVSGGTFSDLGGGVAGLVISVGLTFENAGTPIANNPHTTINLTSGGTFSDAGGGVADLLIDYSTLKGLSTNTFTGSGTIGEVVPTETKLAYNTSYEVDSFAGEVTTNSSSSFTTIATIAVPSSGIIDGSISVVGWDSGGGSSATRGAYRADLTFTAFWDGSAVILLTPSSPANPLNVRSIGLGTSQPWNSQLLISGEEVLVQVLGQGAAAPTPVNWSCIGQIQTRS